MKELAICQSILNMIREKSYSKNFRKVRRIVIEIGEFTKVDKDSLLMCFKEIAKGTFAEGSLLEFFDVPASAFCQTCKRLFLLEHEKSCCSHCASDDVKLLSGEELKIREINVE